ncbi:MAG: MBL fold metallo-hydrolase [Chitinophagaceae bacterium]|nr:MBL fold metallo-hydrolase [Chitinophagaceae bacterium]
MYVEQLYTKCLSEAAYFISEGGEAAIIDPLRDVDVYLRLAEEKQVKIKYIFETHFHADFVSGHLELARQTGATIVYGPDTEASFAFHKAKDGEEFSIGSLKMTVLHTPGHTLESSCYLLHDEQGAPYCIFTGDTLFVGDVGRPDLFSGELSKEELAAKLYHSLNTKIKPLADNIILYPAHGPGSSCGKNLGPDTFSTIGVQKQMNYALQDMTEEEFVQKVTSGLAEPPAYFPINAKINKTGYEELDTVMQKGLTPLDVPAFKALVSEGAWILDTRNSTVFTEAFIPESVSIGLDGRFAEWAGIVLPFGQQLVLVTDEGKEEESITRLARIGFDSVLGFLKGGIEAWKSAGEPLDLIIDIDVDELAMDLPNDKRLEILDVRKETEFNDGHIKGASNMPLSTFSDILTIAMVDPERNLYVHCAGGYRSVIAASLLKRQGFHNLRNVLGGYAKIKEIKEIPLVKTAAENV